MDLYYEHDAPYQVLPPLDDEDYRNLRADIAANGVLIPIEVDENGVIIDGHHRARVCAELGIEPPVRVREGMSEQEKRSAARSLNVARRHLDTAAKRAVIADQLREDPTRSNRAIARDLGVSDHTVGNVRRDLDLDQDGVVGRDGKRYAGGSGSGPRRVVHLTFADDESIREWRRTVKKLRVEGELLSETLTRVLKEAVE